MKMKSTFSVMMFLALLLSCMTAFGAYNLKFRTSVQLSANKNEITSSGYAGNFAKGGLYVHSGSAGKAKVLLQNSTGTGWKTLETVSVNVGQIGYTNIWGLGSVDFLYRITVQSDPKYLIGNPGRIATGYLYTGFEG